MLGYGVLGYTLFLATFGYAVGFVGDLVVPKSIDSGPTGPLGEALAVNAALLGLFALQHSGMARRAFKSRILRLVPHAMERPTYVLATNAALGLLFWQWRPLPEPIWTVAAPAARTALHALYASGWAVVVLSTLMIGHFDLFGLRQPWLYFRNRPTADLGFRTPGFYRYVRHPIQLGFLMAFWAAPDMTAGRLLFALGTTAYILVALRLEERDLLGQFGALYARYRERVRMFLPIRRSA